MINNFHFIVLNTCKFNTTVHLLIVSTKDIISTIIEG